MISYRFDDFNITPEKKGAQVFSKVSFPIRYGRYSEIETSDYLFQFNLNGEIKFIQGRNSNWPHPNEWLKRTVTNDWIYYSTGGYEGVYSLMGEYYLPCLSDSSNSLIRTYAFDRNIYEKATGAWENLIEKLKSKFSSSISDEIRCFIQKIINNDHSSLARRSSQFRSIIKGPITVLPPDSRHVDYELIPIIVADGCLYNCGFCRIKTGLDFNQRTKEDILSQIRSLKTFYGSDIKNYNALFLGQHDALNADRELIIYASETAYTIFEFETSYLNGAFLFLFASADSLLKAKGVLFESLNKLPFYTYINLGLESPDPNTLKALKKPVEADRVREAFQRMISINKQYRNIEITANFVMGDHLPSSHETSLLTLMRDGPDRYYSKGAIYLSPITDRSNTKDMLKRFTALKNSSRLPTFAYLIQKL